MEHTPGPWGINGLDSENRHRICRGRGGWNIALVLPPAGVTSPDEAVRDKAIGEWSANSNLISAARDLLEACNLLRNEIHALHLLDVKKRYSLCVADAAAGKAIAKAEGRD